MPRGSGFVHLNTPAAISYSPGQQVSLSDLRQVQSRAECVVLPPVVGVWRAAFRQYVRAEGLAPFARDAEAEQDGGGAILPPLSAAPAAKRDVRTAKQSAASPTANISAAAPASSGIAIVSHHRLVGERVFVYPDYDGVLSAGAVPRVVVSEEEKAEMEEDRKHYVSPQTMTEEERIALDELQAMWKSRANSHSVQGARHRAAAGHVAPNAVAAEELENDDERRRRGEDDGGPRRQRFRQESRDVTAESAAETNTGNDLDEALRIAGELLDF